MNNSTKVLGLVLVISLLSLCLGVVNFVTVSSIKVDSLGGSTSDNWNVAQALTVTGSSTLTGTTFAKSLVTGSGMTTVTPAPTTTITAAQICAGGGVINWAPSVANATATLPTTASLQSNCLPTAGNSIVVRFRNTSTTSNFNLVAGTGMTIFHIHEVATSTAQSNLVSSSSPALVRITLTLASSTDSTASTDVVRMITP